MLAVVDEPEDVPDIRHGNTDIQGGGVNEEVFLNKYTGYHPPVSRYPQQLLKNIQNLNNNKHIEMDRMWHLMSCQDINK